MSDELPAPEPVIWQMTEEKLREIVLQAKWDDLTKSQFEREKTERVKALCQAIAASCDAENDFKRDTLFDYLRETISQTYQKPELL